MGNILSRLVDESAQKVGDTGVPNVTSWHRAVDRQLWREDATTLTGYAI